ncbi:MAG: hypothetical protein GVY16_06615 [Planctomycetes bacterium]|jgi:threonine/homoserine/homoserine lactone efflux protein|nr:hypothetical protein [Phycisphaerae bacterium]NBB95398.1 hypothetical protein [Planctomycetota bacterium]
MPHRIRLLATALLVAFALTATVFGVGSALLAALAAHHVAKTYNAMRKVERVARGVTGAVFILAGVYLSLKCSFALPI